ncbi:hypothetical protein Q5P01_005163 [Channa striata]|uniref:Uncharacterized protein n=1 Tax=Channa striata TaxID=64152 RepID=A0AA88NH43_CHASR|nr:hypothetical protein Q5P01_005163 [Channa striata]
MDKDVHVQGSTCQLFQHCPSPATTSALHASETDRLALLLPLTAVQERQLGCLRVTILSETNYGAFKEQSQKDGWRRPVCRIPLRRRGNLEIPVRAEALPLGESPA